MRCFKTNPFNALLGAEEQAIEEVEVDVSRGLHVRRQGISNDGMMDSASYMQHVSLTIVYMANILSSVTNVCNAPSFYTGKGMQPWRKSCAKGRQSLEW
jgi:hypothetical protein